MNESIKQAMHLDACKSFGAAEANENERRWDDKMIDSKNNDSINNYDKTRMRLNFEIGPDGKIHSLGYQDKRLDVRLQERLKRIVRFSPIVVLVSSLVAIESVHWEWHLALRI